MKTAIFLFYFTISLLLSSSVCGQTTTITDRNRLNSLLLAGDPEAAMDYWLTVCKPVAVDTSSTACGTTIEQLQDLLDYVALFEEQKPAYTGEVIADGRTQGAKFGESYAGPSADRAFQAFLAAADGEDWLKAITYLRTARFFKIQFVTKTLVKAHDDYLLADKYFAEGEYDSADSTLKTIRFDASNHPNLLAYTDTISYLQQRVDRKLLEIEKRQHYWERTASVNSGLSFSLSGEFINQPGSKALPLIMSNADATIQVEISRVPPTFRPGLGLQAWYNLNERTAVGVGVNAAKFSYSSVHTPQLIFFEFDVAYSRAYLGGRYLLRSEVGLRPYLSLGLGVMRYKYDQIECVILLPPSETETYQVAAGDFSTGDASFTFGAQYVPNGDSRWAVTSEFAWYRSYGTHAFLPAPRLSFGMRIDLLM